MSENKGDLISRTAVYERACVGCIRHGDYPGECYHDEPCDNLIYEFAVAPAVDAVEVVRCEDCDFAKPYERNDGLTVYYCGFCGHSFRYGSNWERVFEPVKEADDFCSYGKERTVQAKARLIDADALNQKFIETKIVEVFPYWKQLPFNVKSAMIEYAQAVKDIIQNAPTVDAQPVHGRWVYHMHFEDESKRDDFDVVCSHCGDFLVSCYDAEEAEIFRRDYGWCPKCGAKMDGGEEHDGE